MKIYVLFNYTTNAESQQAFGREELNLVRWVDCASLQGSDLITKGSWSQFILHIGCHMYGRFKFVKNKIENLLSFNASHKNQHNEEECSQS